MHDSIRFLILGYFIERVDFCHKIFLNLEWEKWVVETGSDFRTGSEDTLKYTGFWILDFGVWSFDFGF